MSTQNTEKQEAVPFGISAKKQIKVKDNSVWDGPWYFILDVKLYAGSKYICPHLKKRKLRAIVVAKNQGGYASTGVCLDCILEAAKTL